jgi:hypothetical protein
LIRQVAAGGKGDGLSLDMDWVFGMASWMRFAVEDVPRGGLGNRLRRLFGRPLLLKTVLSIRFHYGKTLILSIAPDYVGVAHLLVAKANRAVGAEASTSGD